MKLLFGSIVVKGAGRINGHVVRNFRGMPLLTRLALPTKTNKFLSNSQLSVSTLAFKYWSTLAAPIRRDWSAIAGEIFFKDRWGNEKFLSGRDFVSYVFINLKNIQREMISPASFTNTFPSFTISAVKIDISESGFFIIDFAPSDTIGQMIFLKLGLNDVREYSPKQLKFIIPAVINEETAYSIFEKITGTGIVFEVGQTWSIGIKAISESGLASPMAIYRYTIDS